MTNVLAIVGPYIALGFALVYTAEIQDLDPVQHYFVNAQLLPAIPLETRTPFREEVRLLGTTEIYPVPLVEYTDQRPINDLKSVVRNNGPERRLLTRGMKPDSLDQPPEKLSRIVTNTTVSSKKQIHTEMNLEHGKTALNMSSESQSRGNVTENTSKKPANGTVIVDERSSFDGDKCPTGYVRLNGKCVEKD